MVSVDVSRRQTNATVKFQVKQRLSSPKQGYVKFSA